MVKMFMHSLVSTVMPMIVMPMHQPGQRLFKLVHVDDFQVKCWDGSPFAVVEVQPAVEWRQGQAEEHSEWICWMIEWVALLAEVVAYSWTPWGALVVALETPRCQCAGPHGQAAGHTAGSVPAPCIMQDLNGFGGLLQEHRRQDNAMVYDRTTILGGILVSSVKCQDVLHQ